MSNGAWDRQGEEERADNGGERGPKYEEMENEDNVTDDNDSDINIRKLKKAKT